MCSFIVVDYVKCLYSTTPHCGPVLCSTPSHTDDWSSPSLSLSLSHVQYSHVPATCLGAFFHSYQIYTRTRTLKSFVSSSSFHTTSLSLRFLSLVSLIPCSTLAIIDRNNSSRCASFRHFLHLPTMSEKSTGSPTVTCT